MGGILRDSDIAPQPSSFSEVGIETVD